MEHAIWCGLLHIFSAYSSGHYGQILKHTKAYTCVKLYRAAINTACDTSVSTDMSSIIHDQMWIRQVWEVPCERTDRCHVTPNYALRGGADFNVWRPYLRISTERNHPPWQCHRVLRLPKQEIFTKCCVLHYVTPSNWKLKNRNIFSS